MTLKKDKKCGAFFLIPVLLPEQNIEQTVE